MFDTPQEHRRQEKVRAKRQRERIELMKSEVRKWEVFRREVTDPARLTINAETILEETALFARRSVLQVLHTAVSEMLAEVDDKCLKLLIASGPKLVPKKLTGHFVWGQWITEEEFRRLNPNKGGE